MTTRYFTEEPVSGDRAKLAGAEAHHLIHVMRAAPGTQVVLFDGGGCEFDATVKEIGRTAVELDVLRRCEIDRELPLEITLAVPLPKGDRQRWLVEKATELGVRRLVPLTTERSVAQPAPRALERLRRTVIEASKQCGRNRLMEIAEPADWARFVTTTGETAHRWLAHPGGKGSSGDSGEGAMGGLPALAEPREDKGGQAAHGTPIGPVPFFPPTGPCVLAVGPEGGFTTDEVALATDAGWQPIDLGPRILRIETAAVLMTGLVIAGAGPK